MYVHGFGAPTHRLVVGLVIVVALVGAACATTYKPRGTRGGGYSDYRIAEDVFSVSFKGNTATPEELAEKYLLRRASEVTLEHGFAYFAIEAEKGRTRSSSLGYSGVKFPLVAPGSAIRIRCFKDQPPEDVSSINAVDFLRFNFPEVLKKLQLEGEASPP